MVEHNEPELTDEEMRKLRKIIQQDERMQWLWSSLRIWALWITAAVVGLTTFWDFIKKVVRGAIG